MTGGAERSGIACDKGDLGSRAAQYTLLFRDEARVLPGRLTLTLRGNVVPGPASLALMGGALLLMARRKRRKV